ncbi:MAG: cation:proton antiporter [Propionibacteriaceae bacterium]|nr:cation:proton antiporter [Micropruina sp.]HBX81753.1 sodium:proton antiporter [Propionibacteriaceae bacterium]HBY23207.1 sodium:proton antiporter [Propionibacteriaceae bacterium]
MNFAVLVLICATALAGPLLSLQRFAKIPVVIGELLVGLLLGASGFNLVSAKDPTFSFLADMGFALVMFVAGSHVPLRDPALRSGAARGIGRALLIGVLSAAAGLGLDAAFHTGHGMIYAVLIASSSASVILPSLSGEPMTGRPMVEMLPQIALADAACIVVVPFVIDPANVGRAALGALLIVVLGAAAFALFNWAEKTGRRHKLHEVSEERGLALELRLTLILLFGLSAVAQSMHVSFMLAGFVSGLVVAGIGKPRRLSNQTFALTEGLFGPIFFVWLGSSLDLRALASNPQSILLGVALGVVAILVHGLMVLTKQPLPVAVITAAQLGVPVAAATLGNQLGILHAGEDTAMLLGAVVTLAASTAVSGAVSKIAEVSAKPGAAMASGLPPRPVGSGT